MDSIRIVSPAGSALEVGSWLQADPGPDFGARGLLQAIEAESFGDGGVLGYERAGIRRMQFPLSVHAMLGPNLIPNFGFEAGTYAPLTFDGFAINAASVVQSASAYQGSYFLRTVTGGNAASGYSSVANPPVRVTPGERVHIAAAFNEFVNPTSVSILDIVFDPPDNPGGGSFLFTTADTRTPGYRFGSNDGGNLSNMRLAVGTWQLVGGNLVVPSGYGWARLGVYAAWNPVATSVTGLDQLELRTMSPERSTREWESQIRSWARPGAVVDIQPEGVPTAEAVRFDIVHGRYEQNYNLYHQRVGWRMGALQLDTQPYGYWPTWITLASAASWGIPTALPLTAASGVFIGDAPGLVQLVVQPTVGNTASARVDGLAWGISDSASFTPWLRGASWQIQADGRLTTGTPTLISTASGLPYSEYQRVLGVANGSAWGLLAYYPIPGNLLPAFNGNYRAFAVAALDNRGYISADVAGYPFLSFASAAAQPTINTTYQGAVATVGPGVGIYDLGPISIPMAGSGVATGDQYLRLWSRVATHQNNASGYIALAGVYLVPQDIAGGVLARGLLLENEFSRPSQARFVIDSQARGVWAASPGANLSLQQSIQADLRPNYYGAMPQLNASAAALCVLPFTRLQSEPSVSPPGMLTGNTGAAAMSVRYQPRFQFLKGL